MKILLILVTKLYLGIIDINLVMA